MRNTYAGSNRAGQIALPFLLLICGFIVEVAIAGAFVVYFVANSEAGERFSYRALSAAHSGLRDALIQVSRNKELVSGPTSTFVMDLGSDSATVETYRISDPISDSYEYIITSVGAAFTSRKKLRATAYIDKTTGALQLGLVEELPL